MRNKIKKKSLIIFIMVVTLMATTLSGCKSLGKAIGKALKDGSGSGEENSEDISGGGGTERPSGDGGDALSSEPEDGGVNLEGFDDSRDLYFDFLNGNATLTVASNSYFSEEMEEYSSGDLLAGREFDYVGLKQAFYRYNDKPSDTRYAFVDLDKDGREEMVLSLECTDPSFMNWCCFIRDNGGSLEMTYQYADGYRTTSGLYESGALIIGGSWSAGAYGYDYLTINEKGVGEIQYSINNYFAGFATEIAYDLKQDGTGLENDALYMNNIGTYSDLSVCEYVPARRDGTGVKICPEQYSEDPDTRESEEELINVLVALGAELVDEAEMDRLIHQLEVTGPEVTYYDWEEQCTILNAENFEYMYPQPDDYNYYEFSDGEYAVNIAITTNKSVTDVEAFTLAAENDDEAGIAFRVSESVSLGDLTPERPLVIRLEFAGDLPGYGLSYMDEQGVLHECTISQSGWYGSQYYLSEDDKIIH